MVKGNYYMGAIETNQKNIIKKGGGKEKKRKKTPNNKKKGSSPQVDAFHALGL